MVKKFHIKRYILAMLLFVFHVGADVYSETPLELNDNWLRFATSNLDLKCDSLLARFTNNPDNVELTRAIGLEIKDAKYLNSSGRSMLAILMGCVGNGEIVLIDSIEEGQVYSRKEINIPSRYASFSEFIDVNNDGVMEISIHLSSGSHSTSLVLVSIYRDSLSFITNEKGWYQFVAPGGIVQLKDLDGDKVYEIILDDLIRPSEKSAPERRQIIYKWEGDKYVKTEAKEKH